MPDIPERYTTPPYGRAMPQCNVFRRIVTVLVFLLTVYAAPGQADAEIRILGLGNSLMAGYGLPPGESFPDQLQRALAAEGIESEVVNAGVSGDTTAGGRSRLDWALASEPHAVILELGANDGLRGLDPDETRRNLDAMLTTLGEKKLPVLLAGMLAPPNLGREYGAEFEAVFRELAEKHGAVFYPFFLDGVAGNPALNLPDGIHPTSEGVGVIVERILPQVKTLIARTETAAR